MSRFFYKSEVRFEVLAQGDTAPEETPLSFDSPEAAYAYLEPFSTERGSMDAFRAALVQEDPLLSVHRRRKHEVLTQLAWRVHSGFVTVAPRAIMARGTMPGGTFSPGASPPAEAPTPMMAFSDPGDEDEEEEVMLFITFQVLDDDNSEPVPGVKLEIRLPDGSLETFTTDSDGIIHIPDLEPGTCTIERMIDDHALEVVSVE